MERDKAGVGNRMKVIFRMIGDTDIMATIQVTGPYRKEVMHTIKKCLNSQYAMETVDVE
jgi:hypothetical protein